MYFDIEREFFAEHVAPLFPEDSYMRKRLNSQTRFGSTEIQVDPTFLTLDEIETLYNVAKEHKNKSLMSSITALRSMLRDLQGAKITSLKALEAALPAYLQEGMIDGWLYYMDRDGILHPYVVLSVRYNDGDSRQYESASVSITMTANSKDSYESSKTYKKELRIDSGEIRGKTIAQVLESKGYFHETEELKQDYEENLALFMDYQPKFNEQFWIEGMIYDAEGYSRNERVLSARAKAVNDEGLLRRKFVETADNGFWAQRGVEEGFTNVPFHTYINLFHLDIHKNVWAHVSRLTPYAYDKSLRDKLILPDTHRDLIDILVQDMDILADDIIAGKSGGTTILCEGEAGLGKTLSAEVYSEVIEKPLYRVHSGQLGLSMHKVEEKLEEILKRAARWGAVLLLDEADVYIRQRGNDLEHNAVVASFLRTLEYFTGLLFMTTNRGDDVDDAILSRCIAVIKYEYPNAESATKIWKVLSSEFQVELSDDLIGDLVKAFPRASGRDIKQLLKLSAKYAYGKKVPLDMEVFRACAQFRGL